MGDDAQVRGVPQELGIAQKPVFVRLDRMCLQFDNGPSSQGTDPLDPRPWFERLQREKQIGLPVPARQHAVDRSAIESVPDTLLSGLEAEVPSDERPGGKKTGAEDVRAQMHVVMAIDVRGIGSIQTP